MKKLKVDMDQLMWRFEDASAQFDYFLGTETGELFSEEELPEDGENKNGTKRIF